MAAKLNELLDELGDENPLKGGDLIPENPEDPDKDELPIKTENHELLLLSQESSADPSAKYAENFSTAMGLFSKLSTGILEELESDREQTQDIIDHLFNTIQNSGKISPVYVESLVNAMRNKSDINLTAIRAMDSISKFITAGKGNDALNNMNVNINIAELNDILKKEAYEDEK